MQLSVSQGRSKIYSNLKQSGASFENIHFLFFIYVIIIIMMWFLLYFSSGQSQTRNASYSVWLRQCPQLLADQTEYG